jgi:hypothetical protein
MDPWSGPCGIASGSTPEEITDATMMPLRVAAEVAHGVVSSASARALRRGRAWSADD